LKSCKVELQLQTEDIKTLQLSNITTLQQN